MVSPFLCGRKGVYFGWIMDSIFEQPLQGRVNPVGEDCSHQGFGKGSECVKMKMVCRDTNIYSSVNSKEEKEHPLLQLGLKKAPYLKWKIPICSRQKEMNINSSIETTPKVQF